MLKAFRRAALPLLASVALASVPACGLTGVSEQDEIRLGQQTAAQVEQRYRTYSDPTVREIGMRLAAASRRPNLPWRFRVIESTEVNAVSLPGGPVYVFEGLLTRIRTDPTMVAAVLGHEIGHIERRHAARQIERSQWYGLGTAILRRTAGGDVGVLADVAANLQLLHYSRKQEYEADDAAIRLTMATGYDPMGLVRLLELLQRLGSSGPSISWLRTHPSTQARIDRARERIAAMR